MVQYIFINMHVNEAYEMSATPGDDDLFKVCIVRFEVIGNVELWRDDPPVTGGFYSQFNNAELWCCFCC